MLERRRGSQIAVLKIISEARKSLLENPDDFAEQCLFSLRVIAGSAPFEVSPIVEPASKSNYQDGLPRRTESRIAAEHCDFEPVMPSRVVHYQRTRERQADCLGRFRKGPIDAQRCLEQRREGLAVTVGVAELFVEIPALKHLEERRAAIGAGDYGGSRHRRSVRTPHTGDLAILDGDRFHLGTVAQNATEAGVAVGHRLCKGPRTADDV